MYAVLFIFLIIGCGAALFVTGGIIHAELAEAYGDETAELIGFVTIVIALAIAFMDKSDRNL